MTARTILTWHRYCDVVVKQIHKQSYWMFRQKTQEHDKRKRWMCGRVKQKHRRRLVQESSCLTVCITAVN